MATRERVTSPEITLWTVSNSHAHPVGGKTRRTASVWPPGGRLRSRPSPEERGRLGSGWPVGSEHRQKHRCYFPKMISKPPHLFCPLFLKAMFHFSKTFLLSTLSALPYYNDSSSAKMRYQGLIVSHLPAKPHLV